jgi:hypothetical protein
LTERINLEDLAAEAQRYRYRVNIERGTRNAMIPRKRENETTIDGQNTKRQRIDVIELSSDGEELPQPVAGGRRVSPVSIGSSTSDDDSSSSDDDLENTLVDERGETTESSTSSIEKEKQNEDFVDLTLDFQEELECIICCIPFRVWTNCSYTFTCSPNLFSLWSWRLWTLQYFPLKLY